MSPVHEPDSAVSLRSRIRTRIRSILPDSIVREVNKIRFWKYRQQFGSMNRRDVFSTVYKERIFGDAPGQTFYSGDGSAEQFAESYCQLVGDHIAQHGIASVVDLGCGDFRIGSKIASLVPQYRGIDIVPQLIEYNTRHFGSERIRFECLDIVADPLPPADLCLIRQVFQHLSNSEIRSVLEKLKTYPWVVITENVPSGTVSSPNIDHVHGPKTRLVEGSGVFVTEPPFSRPAVRVWDSPYDENSKLLTVLLRP